MNTTTQAHYLVFTGGTSAVLHFVSVPLCPDLLRYIMLGEADTWRGRLVRGFFWVLDLVTVRG
jgi:hypothetical protein